MAAEDVTAPPPPPQLEAGSCYLLKERKPDLAYKMFDVVRANRGLPGLVVTRQYPERLREERGLRDARVLWLSHTPGSEHMNPTALGTLAKVIVKFIEDAGGAAVVLLDGLEFLSVNNGFLQTLMFLEHVNEFVMQKPALLLIPLRPEALDEKELALLERNVEVLEGDTLRVDLERVEVTRLLETY